MDALPDILFGFNIVEIIFIVYVVGAGVTGGIYAMIQHDELEYRGKPLKLMGMGALVGAFWPFYILIAIVAFGGY